MQELNFINTWLGGHDISIDGVKSLIGGKKMISVCEIGCGGGDNLKAIYSWATKIGMTVDITGIDIKKECIDFAKENCAELPHANWICSDYSHIVLPNKPDIIFSSLFCHHFSDEGVIQIFQWMQRNSRLGFFINDLQRHPLAYYSIRLLTALFSRSYLVKNDAPLSVLRGFSKFELESMLKTAFGEPVTITFEINWKWAFRWLLIGYQPLAMK